MGTVFTIRLLDGEVLVRAADYTDLVAAIPLRDSLTAVLVERDGGVWSAAVDDLSKDRAGLVAQLAGPAVAGGLHPDPGACWCSPTVLRGRRRSRLLRSRTAP